MASPFRASQGRGVLTVSFHLCLFSFHLVSRSETLPRKVALEDTQRQTHSDMNGFQSQPLREFRQPQTLPVHLVLHCLLSSLATLILLSASISLTVLRAWLKNIATL